MGNMGKSENVSRGNEKNSGKDKAFSFYSINISIAIAVFLILVIVWAQLGYWYEQDLYSEMRAEEDKNPHIAG